jgi:hypothetical protein
MKRWYNMLSKVTKTLYMGDYFSDISLLLDIYFGCENPSDLGLRECDMRKPPVNPMDTTPIQRASSQVLSC